MPFADATPTNGRIGRFCLWPSLLTLLLGVVLVVVVAVPQVGATCYDVAGDFTSLWNEDLITTQGVLSNGNFNGKWHDSFMANGEWILKPQRFCSKVTMLDQVLTVDPEISIISKGKCDSGSHNVTLFIGGLYNFYPEGELGMVGCYHCRFWGIVCETS